MKIEQRSCPDRLGYAAVQINRVGWGAAFLQEHKLSSESVAENDEVIQYLGGEAPSSISEIVKFGLFEEEGNFTYIVLKFLSADFGI